MDAAVAEVQSGTKIALAAFMNRVPESTLRDYLRSVELGRTPRPVGHPRQLTEADERAIVNWTQLRALLRFPVSKDEILERAAAIAKKRGNPFRHSNGEESDRPSEHWWEQFRDRHKGQVKYKRGSKLKAAQAELTREVLDQTYDLVADLCKEYGIAERDVWNFDECGFDRALGEKEKVLGPANMQRFQFFQKFAEHVSIGTAINAAGERMDPFFIFQGRETSSHEKAATNRMLAGLGSFRPGIAWTSNRFCLFLRFFL